MRSGVRWLSAILPLLLAGCVSFSEPVAGAPDERIDPAPYLGSWSAEPYASLDVEIAEAGSGALEATIIQRGVPDEESPPTRVEIRLTDIDGQVIASLLASGEEFGSSADRWFLGRVERSADGDRLTIRTPDDVTITQAVASGALKGRRTAAEVDEASSPSIPIEASGAALRAFVSDHRAVLDAAEAFVLTRGSAATAAAGAADAAYLPTAAVDSDVESEAKAYGSEAQGYGRSARGQEQWPSAPPAEPTAEPPSDWGRYQSSPDMGYPGGSGYGYSAPPMPNRDPGSYGGGMTTGSPAGGGAAAAAAPGLPQPVKNIVVGLALLMGLGVAVAVGLDVLKRRARSEARRTSADAGMSAGVEVADGSVDADAERHGFLWLLRRSLAPGLLVLAVVTGPLLYLTVILGGLGFPGWSLLAPAMQAIPTRFAPIALVFSIGAMLAVAEVASAFGAFAAEALRTRWAALLVAFNALGGATVYAAAATASPPAYGYYGAPAPSPLLRALGFALGFAVLIRTRFVIARRLPAAATDAAEPASTLPGTDDVPSGAARRDGMRLDLGWPYARLQQVCAQRIDRDLLRDDRYATARLLAFASDTAALEHIALDSIRQRDPSEANALHEQLEAIRAEDAADGLVRARIALFAAATGGPEHTRFVLKHGAMSWGAVAHPSGRKL